MRPDSQTSGDWDEELEERVNSGSTTSKLYDLVYTLKMILISFVCKKPGMEPLDLMLWPMSFPQAVP